MTTKHRLGYTRADWLWIGLAAATLIPLVLVRFAGLGTDRPVVVATVTGLAIIAAAFSLSWATGTHGIFLLDDWSLALASALSLRMLSTWLTAFDVMRIITSGFRLALVNATGGHFASTVAAARLRKGSRLRASMIQVFSMQTPLPTLDIEKLPNLFLLSKYTSTFIPLDISYSAEYNQCVLDLLTAPDPCIAIRCGEMKLSELSLVVRLPACFLYIWLSTTSARVCCYVQACGVSWPRMSLV